jgi:hypothetical protein
MFTVYVTASCDNLSRYFLCSNDSNGGRMRRKWLRGRGMDRNLVRENGVCARLGQARRFSGGEVKTRTQIIAGCYGARQESTEKDPPFRQPNPKGWGTPGRKRQSQNRPSELRVCHPQSFGAKWTLLLSQGIDSRTGTFTSTLDVKDSEGEDIVSIGTDEDARIHELHEMARRHALKIDEALADLLNEIDKPKN